MPSSYPSGLDALQRVAAGDSMQSTSHSGLHNSQSDAIEAIQTVLGLSPQGGSATVSARCAALESGKASLSGSVSFGGTVGGTGLSGSLLSSASPVMNGAASAGTAVVPSRQDHVHPSDTSRAALSGATFTGDVTLSKASPAFTIAASAGNADFIWKAPAGAATRMYLQTASSARWLLQKDSSSESGSNAGSNLIIGSFTDAGATLRDDFKITRSSGRWTIGSVGASAGLEYGASGPRDMVGTGSPEGVVTAPVGSTWRDTNATTGAIRWIKASGSGNTGWTLDPNVIPVAVGSRVDLTGPYFTSSGGAPTNIGDLFMSPVYVPCAMTISRIDLRVSGGAGAGATWRLGFWKLDGTGGTPNTLIADLGTLDPTTTGVKAITGLSTVLPAGRVAFGFALQGTGTGGGYTYAAPPPTITDTGSGTRYVASHSGWLATAVTGAFGATQSNNPAALGFCTPHLVVERSA